MSAQGSAGVRVRSGAVAWALLFAMTLAPAHGAGASEAASTPAAIAGGARSHGDHLLFVPNTGQFPAAVRYQILGAGATAWLTRDALWMSAIAPPATGRSTSPSATAPHRAFERGVHVRIGFAGVEPDAPMIAIDRRPTRTSSFVGDDPARWRSGVPCFGAVSWRGAYPGVTIELRAVGGRLAIVVDAADPAAVARVHLRIQGAGALRQGEGGMLVARTALGDLALPAVVEGGPARRRLVAAIRGGGTVSFAPASGASSPASASRRARAGGAGLLYGTYLGGSDDDDVFDLARGADGSTYAVGRTFSADFPTTPGAFDTRYQGGGSFGGDVFVSKLDPTGATLVWSTFLGGSDTDTGLALAVGRLGGVVLAGYTYAHDFPTTGRAFQPAFAGGCCDAFVTKLSSSGGRLVYSTFLGGGSFDEITALALGTDRSIHVTGETLSPDFPTTAGAFDRTLNGDGNGLYADAFVAALDTRARTLLHATFLGGKYNDAGEAIALGSTGEEYVGGSAQSPDFPTTRHAFDRSFNGGGSGDAFVTRLTADGVRLRFSTYLGGSDDDDVSAVAVGPGGQVYVAGTTSSPDFPTTPGAYDRSINSFIFSDLFATEMDPGGRSLGFSTFIGGDDSDIAGDMALDAEGVLTITGTTYSDDFPTTVDAFDRTLGGPADALVSRLDATGSALVYSTYLGGTGSVIDRGAAVLAVGPDVVSVAGSTFSDDFPTTPGAFDTTSDGGFDGFVVLLGIGPVR